MCLYIQLRAIKTQSTVHVTVLEDHSTVVSHSMQTSHLLFPLVSDSSACCLFWSLPERRTALSGVVSPFKDGCSPLDCTEAVFVYASHRVTLYAVHSECPLGVTFVPLLKSYGDHKVPRESALLSYSIYKKYIL